MKRNTFLHLINLLSCYVSITLHTIINSITIYIFGIFMDDYEIRRVIPICKFYFKYMCCFEKQEFVKTREISNSKSKQQYNCPRYESTFITSFICNNFCDVINMNAANYIWTSVMNEWFDRLFLVVTCFYVCELRLYFPLLTSFFVMLEGK